MAKETKKSSADDFEIVSKPAAKADPAETAKRQEKARQAFLPVYPNGNAPDHD